MATRTKAKAVTPADRHVAITNLGANVAKLVGRFGGGITFEGLAALSVAQKAGAMSDGPTNLAEANYAIGQQIDKALRAGIKAQIEGRQSTAQVTARLDAARKAVNRALARMVAG